MARGERYSYSDGKFFTPDGEVIALAAIPQNATVALPMPDGTTEYLVAWHIQEPGILQRMAEHSCYSDQHPDDAAVRQHYRELHAFITELAGGQP